MTTTRMRMTASSCNPFRFFICPPLDCPPRSPPYLKARHRAGFFSLSRKPAQSHAASVDLDYNRHHIDA